MRLVIPRKAIVGWAQPDVRDEFTNSWEQIDEAVADEREALMLLEQLIERPALDFQLDYAESSTFILSPLAAMKRAAQRLNAAALSDLHRGDPASAAVRVRA